MTAAVQLSAAHSAASTAAFPSPRDSSTVPGAADWFMRSSLHSSLDRQSMPSSAARARDSVVLPEPGHPPTSTKPSMHSTLPATTAPSSNRGDERAYRVPSAQVPALRAIGALVARSVLVLAGGFPASAETYNHRDARHDVEAWKQPHHAPGDRAADITTAQPSR